jgi:hypothetical protein
MIKNSIKLFKHCELCKNKSQNLEIGVFCSLTNKNPNFDRFCDKISFNENLEKKITEVNIAFQKTKREKNYVYSYFVVYCIMSLGVFFFTYIFNNYITNILSKASGRPLLIGSSIIIIFICIGFVLLSYAFGTLNRYRFDSKKNNEDKQELDAILKLYNIEYDFKISFKDRMLMPTDIKTELKIKNLKV